jgi:hypothetical protein
LKLKKQHYGYQDEMTTLHFEDGNIEINNELQQVVGYVLKGIGFKSTEDLKEVIAERFFEISTPAMNRFYNRE